VQKDFFSQIVLFSIFFIFLSLVILLGCVYEQKNIDFLHRHPLNGKAMDKYKKQYNVNPGTGVPPSGWFDSS